MTNASTTAAAAPQSGTHLSMPTTASLRDVPRRVARCTVAIASSCGTIVSPTSAITGIGVDAIASATTCVAPTAAVAIATNSGVIHLGGWYGNLTSTPMGQV